MNHNLNNTVVLSLNPEHGAEIIKAWKALGVDVDDYVGVFIGNYYGIVNGFFQDIPSSLINEYGLKIITLPELQAMAEPCKYTRAEKSNVPFPRVEYEAECGYNHVEITGYKVGESSEWLKELNYPSGTCHKCGRTISVDDMAEPQQPERTFPREMEVSHNNKNWAIRTVLLYDKDTYFAVDKSDEKRFKRNRNFFCITWKYAREIE